MSDQQLISKLTRITFAVCGALAVILFLGTSFLFSDGSVRTRGMIIGVALGLVSWFGSRWITSYSLSRAARTGAADVTGVVLTVAFSGIAIGETPAMLGLVLAYGTGGDVGSFVIPIPIAIVAIIVNASGPAAVRRHLDRLRA